MNAGKIKKKGKEYIYVADESRIEIVWEYDKRVEDWYVEIRNRSFAIQYLI